MKHSEQNPKNLEELSHLSRKINSWAACPEGPSRQYYKKASPECAVKDPYSFTWRHVNCEVILEEGSVCKYCASLHSTLSRNIDRKCFGRIKKTSRMNKLFDQEVKNTLHTIKKDSKKSKMLLRKRDKQLIAIQKDLNESSAKFKELKEKSFEDIIGEMEIAENEVN